MVFYLFEKIVCRVYLRYLSLLGKSGLIFIIMFSCGNIEQVSGQDFLSIKKEEIKNNIALNDIKSLEYNLNQVFLKESDFKKQDLIDFYLYRIKLNKSLGKQDNIVRDLDTIFKYDSTNAQAYLYKVPFIRSPKDQIIFMETGFSKVVDKQVIIKDIAQMKIGALENYIDDNRIKGVDFNIEKAILEIPYAQGGCNMLQDISEKDIESAEIYKKKCNSELVKLF